MSTGTLYGTPAEILTEIFPALFNEVYEGGDPIYSQAGGFSTPIRMLTKEAVFTFLKNSQVFREWVGDRELKRFEGQEYRFEIGKYENSFEVDADELNEKSKIMSYELLVREMAQGAADHPDLMHWGFLEGGALTEAGIDGVPLLSASHPKLHTSGTDSNIDSGGSGVNWYLFDNSRVLKAFLWGKDPRRDYRFRALMAEEAGNVDGFMRDHHLMGVDTKVGIGAGDWRRVYKSNQALTTPFLSDARATMKQRKDHQGNPIRVNPRTLVVPPSLETAARQLATAERDSSGATNIMKGTIDVVVCEYLADA